MDPTVLRSLCGIAWVKAWARISQWGEEGDPPVIPGLMHSKPRATNHGHALRFSLRLPCFPGSLVNKSALGNAHRTRRKALPDTLVWRIGRTEATRKHCCGHSHQKTTCAPRVEPRLSQGDH